MAADCSVIVEANLQHGELIHHRVTGTQRNRKPGLLFSIRLKILHGKIGAKKPLFDFSLCLCVLAVKALWFSGLGPEALA